MTETECRNLNHVLGHGRGRVTGMVGACAPLSTESEKVHRSCCKGLGYQGVYL